MLVLLGMVLVAAFLAYGFLFALALRRFWGVPGDFRSGTESLRAIQAGPEQGFSLRLMEVEDGLERLPKKWEEIKREAQAAESRARSHTKRALKELEEHGYSDPGVTQMAGELQLLDGGGSEASGVQPVPEGMAVDEPEVQDWRAVSRMRKFCFYGGNGGPRV